MAIDYSSAGRWAQVVRALAMGESNEDVGLMGDGGRAFGILQQHSAFFVEWYGRYPQIYPIDVADTVWVAQIKAAASFLEHYVPAMGLDLAVESYNQGVEAIRSGKRVPDYLARFNVNLNKVKGQQ